ncbi:MAG: HAD family hydrolase [Spirochaetaceae bacterium]|jgi:HAD superfamily hydrolase (TIGR01509 family)|nr:HAD family hydrolase [Spirochaetaceae bacterium]
MKKNALIFDHDGTLVDSINAVVICTNNTLNKFNVHTASLDQVKSGMALPTLERFEFHSGITDKNKLQEMTDDFYRELHEEGIGHLRLYDGVKETLDKLAASGFALGMVTNNQGLFVRKAAASLGYAFDFEVILGEENVPLPKPHPSGLLQACAGMGAYVENCWYIGDGKSDFDAAQAAGMKSALVSWGALPRKELIRLDSDQLFDKTEEMLEFFLKL